MSGCHGAFRIPTKKVLGGGYRRVPPNDKIVATNSRQLESACSDFAFSSETVTVHLRYTHAHEATNHIPGLIQDKHIQQAGTLEEATRTLLHGGTATTQQHSFVQDGTCTNIRSYSSRSSSALNQQHALSSPVPRSFPEGRPFRQAFKSFLGGCCSTLRSTCVGSRGDHGARCEAGEGEPRMDLLDFDYLSY